MTTTGGAQLVSRSSVTAGHRQSTLGTRPGRSCSAGPWRRRRAPARSVAALCDAARGWRLQRSIYKRLVLDGVGEQISDDSATRELEALVDAGLLAPKGEKRGRTYLPTDDLRSAWSSIRAQRPPRPEEDPYEGAGQPRLPGF